jgi:hypothetical protein
MAAEHADAGRPMPAEVVASSEIECYRFRSSTRQVSIRNTGTNTLWLSFDAENWFDVAAGTSFDDRFVVDRFWYRTQLGRTSFVVNGVSLNKIPFDPSLKV